MIPSSVTRLILTLALALNAAADLTTTIDPTSNRGTWEGWGTSLAWWARAFGTRDDLADIFFTTKTTPFNGQSLPGLGFTIARYNAGASSWNTINNTTKMQISPTMIPSRHIEGYWLDWTSTSPTSPSWDWSVDASQRSMLLKAHSRGATTLELFSNSPMWWMCTNHNPSGSDSGTTDNLQSWNHQQHALYLATITHHFATTHNLTFHSVNPFNEPSAPWWTSKSGTQEGSHFTLPTQATVLTHLRAELHARGLSTVQISASDESYYDEAITTFTKLPQSATSLISRINVHGYQYASGRRDALFSLASSAKKSLWQSEYGEADATGQRLASNLLLDMRWLRPTAWVYWQVLDGGGWGLKEADNDKKTVGLANTKFFVLAQFARHIRPGMRILDGGSDYTVAAYDEKGRKLVIVAVNWGEGQVVNFDLGRFAKGGVDGAVVRRWVTQIGTGNGSRYVKYEGDTRIVGTRLWSRFEKNVVQTFEVEGVVL